LQLYAEDLKASLKDSEKEFKAQIKRLESKLDKALKEKSELFGTLKIKENSLQELQRELRLQSETFI